MAADLARALPAAAVARLVRDALPDGALASRAGRDAIAAAAAIFALRLACM
jgi:histone H3/H4